MVLVEFSVVLPVGSRRFLMFLIGSQWFLVFLVASSVVFCCSHWFSFFFFKVPTH